MSIAGAGLDTKAVTYGALSNGEKNSIFDMVESAARKLLGGIMELKYTYWEGEGWLIGYLDDYPNHMTQGKDIAEPEEMLLDLYEIFQEDAEKEKKQVKKSGILRVPA
jgi:predicted RNase H-like HicB family nuclease